MIFVDEVDALCGARGDGDNDSVRRIKTEFLVQMTAAASGAGGGAGGGQNVTTIGATNLPWNLDPAFRRRFDRRIYIGLPDAAARLGILRLGLGHVHAQALEEGATRENYHQPGRRGRQ